MNIVKYISDKSILIPYLYMIRSVDDNHYFSDEMKRVRNKLLSKVIVFSDEYSIVENLF